MNLLKAIRFNAHKNYISLFKKLDLDEYIHYIGGGAYLPPPLSADEENECILTIGKERSRQTLIEHNLRLVVYIAKKFVLKINFNI